MSKEREKFIKELNGVVSYANSFDINKISYDDEAMIKILLRKLLFEENRCNRSLGDEADGCLYDLEYLADKAYLTAYFPNEHNSIKEKVDNLRKKLLTENNEKNDKINDLEKRLYFIDKVAANILAETKDEEMKNRCKDVFELCSLKTKFIVDDNNNFTFYEKEDK